MKKQTLILFVFLFALSAKAQNFISISGKVTDKQSGKPVSYASISIKNQAIGTVTNTEGAFVFHVPVKYKKDSLAVSSIGYKSYQIKIADIKNGKLNIKLEQKVYDLSEVAVKPKNALEIVKQAIAKIPENYPTEPINMDGFYREMTFENDTCVEMAEAACEFYYRAYDEKFDLNSAYDTYYKYTDSHFDYFINNIVSLPTNPDDRLRIIEGRSSDLFHKNHFIVVPRGGPLSLVSYDIVKTKYILFKPKLLKKFKFSLKDITTYQNKQVYVISYRAKRKKISGLIYLDINSLAFIQISINFKNIGKQKYTAYWTPALYKKKRKRCKDLLDNYNQKIVVNYKKTKNKWYLNTVLFNETFDYIFSKNYINKKNEPKYNYKINKKLLINNYKTQNINKFNNKDNFANSFYSILYEQDLDYNPFFWEHYNIVKTTPLQDSIMRQLQLYQSLEEQYATQFIKNDSLKAPVAKKVPVINPFTKLEDDYFWMQNIKNPDVFKYVEAENKFTENGMLPLKQLRRSLYYEMLDREIKDTAIDKAILKSGDYIYFFKKESGKHSENIYRKNIKTLKEELILDINKLSMGNNNYSVDNIYPSPDNKWIAYTESYGMGYENSLIVKDIEADKIVAKIENVANVFWKNNQNAFLYTTWNSTNKVNRLLYHKIGSNPDNDKVIYYEKNELKRIVLSLYQKRWLILYSEDDFHYGDAYILDLNAENNKLKKIINSKNGHINYVQVYNDTLYSLSHENGTSIVYYSTMKTPEKEHWKVLLKQQNENMRQLLILPDYIAVKEINNMVFTFNIYSKNGLFIKKVDFEKVPNKINFVNDKIAQDNNKIRYIYSSLITPNTIFEYDIKSGKQKIIEQNKFNFKQDNYKTKLLWASSKDGTLIPVSLVYNKKQAKINGKASLYLYAYGSYGSSSTFPEFMPEILSLLDRGIIYATVHVRGGSELGEKWHVDAMQMKKQNTFNDFIAAAEYLIKNKYTSKGKIIAAGGSAGGLVMGVVANQKPDLFNSIILISPFVDVLGSITDSTAKFNKEDYAEFGNPADPEIYNYIKSYSPYQNIKKQNYPNMLYYIGLNDNRVEYWQSLKSVAKLRALKTDNNKLYLKTEPYTGHIGYKGTEAYYIFSAYLYAFILNNLGIKY